MSQTIRVVVLAAAIMFATTMAEAQWVPPIGIPTPSFGIGEVARPVPNPWITATAGFYYVDKSNPVATDTGNAFGTPALPRRTIPLSLPAGSVVELRGLYDEPHNSPRGIVMNGSASAPIFIRGASATSRPVISGYWEVSGSYFILENLGFAAAGTYSGRNQLYILSPTSFGALRFSDVHGALDHGGIDIESYNTNTVSNVVIYSNTIHDNGDLAATSDQDVHGIAVGARVSNLWIVDNEFYRNSGDGIQINAGQTNQATTHHIYVGRNRSHHNKQTGMWTKQAVDVIFSQNTLYAHRPGNSSFGACTGFQYAPHQVWFLFNIISDCDFGIGSGSDSGLGFGTEAYFIGNVIYGIHTTTTYNSNTGWSNAAISLPGGVNRYVVNNTISDVDAGIVTPGSSGTVYMANNLIAGVTQPQGAHVFLEMGSLASGSTFRHGLVDSPARIKWGTSTVYDLNGFKAAFPGQGSGAVNGSPAFVDSAGRDLRLLSGSPAIDTGSIEGVYETFRSRYGIDIARDAAGGVRPQGVAYDMGAYEFASAGSPPPPPPTATAPAAPSNLTVR
jgi:hypothetical protein